MNDHQKHRFAKNIITTLFNTVNGKKIGFLGWAFKKDTNDTRESAAIYVADYLINDGAKIHVFDPKVSENKIKEDLKQLWKLKGLDVEEINRKTNQIKVCNNHKMAVHKSHAIAVLTEWDEFVNYDWDTIYKNMYKPAFIFDGRNILNNENLTNIGFKVRSIGK